MRVLWLLALCGCLWLGIALDAQASVNLPLHHWAYEAIERLAAMGIIDKAMVVPKPYSRKEAAIYVGRAIERVRANDIPRNWAEGIHDQAVPRQIRKGMLNSGIRFPLRGIMLTGKTCRLF